MNTFITCEGIRILKHGTIAPIWRTLATVGNSTALNLAATLALAIGLAYVVKKFLFQEDPVLDSDRTTKSARFAPWLILVTPFCIPWFTAEIRSLSPLCLALVPSVASLAMVASLNSLIAFKDDPDEYECPRRFFWPRLALAGALAAVGAWESTLGLILAPLLLAACWLECIRRDVSVAAISGTWVAGFVAGFVAFGMMADWPWTAFEPVFYGLFGLLSLVLACGIPICLVRGFGENVWTLSIWLLLLVVALAGTWFGGHYRIRDSAAMTFAKTVLADLGNRRYIIGDGIFDDLIDVLKPDDVRLLDIKSNADREFMLEVFDRRETLTNRVLVVRDYHDLPEMDAAAAELGLVRHQPSKPLERTMSNEVARIQSIATPLLGILKQVEEDFPGMTAPERRLAMDNARRVIRKGWENGLVGIRLSTALLKLDLQLGNREVVERDAIMALILDREDPTANGVLGALRQEEGKFDSAERYLRKSVKGGGVFPMGKLAILLFQTGRYAEAETWARKAAERSPKDWMLREPLVAALIENGKFDEATRELDEIRRIADADGRIGEVQKFLETARQRIALKRSPPTESATNQSPGESVK